MPDINTLHVAVIATDGVEEDEIVKPIEALKQAGARVKILSLKPGRFQAFQHYDKGITLKADASVEDSHPDDFDALLLPGGALNADALRTDPAVKKFVKAFDDEKKPIAFICHAPWVLVSAGIVKGRTLTCYHTIADDIRNAGGHYVDHEVACDFNWVSSRQPSDIPAFSREMLHTFSQLAQPQPANR